MFKKRTNREYVLGGLFALMAAFPLVTASDLDVPLEGRVTSDALHRAFDDRDNQSQMRRMRWSILRDCAQREELGEENACPDMNDVDALNRYWLPAEEETATIEETIAATLDDLGNYERNILRRAERNGQCPRDLDGILSGFQALCEQQIADGSERIDQIQEAVNRYRGLQPVNRR